MGYSFKINSFVIEKFISSTRGALLRSSGEKFNLNSIILLPFKKKSTRVNKNKANIEGRSPWSRALVIVN